MANVLKARTRDNLKKSVTKTLRKEGQVPAVLYGSKTENKNVSVDAVEFMKMMRKVGKNGLLSLEIEGKNKHQVLVYDLQVDPIKDEYSHVDFFEVDMKSEIDANVPIRLSGNAPAEKDGGIISQLLYELTVKCLPADIPEELVVDISKLTIGDTVHVADIRNNLPVEIVHEDEEVIITVQPPVAENSAEEEDEAEPEPAGENE